MRSKERGKIVLRNSWIAGSAIAFAVVVGVALRTGARASQRSVLVASRTSPVHSVAPTSFAASALPAAPPDEEALNRLLTHEWAEQVYTRQRPRVTHADVSAPYLALTFDDGPKPWGTPLILDQLEKYHAHATFFLVGKQCVRFPAIVSRIMEDSDEIGNHTFDHPRLPTVPLPQVEIELERNRDTLRRLTGQTVRLFRPPGGRINPEVQAMADSLGYTTVFWKVDSSELEKGMDPDRVYRRVVNNVHSGDVVLLHNGDRNIVLALPRILQTLSDRGFHLVTVSELMQLSGAQPQDEAPDGAHSE